jgi:hypothetical protein
MKITNDMLQRADVFTGGRDRRNTSAHRARIAPLTLEAESLFEHNHAGARRHSNHAKRGCAMILWPFNLPRKRGIGKECGRKRLERHSNAHFLDHVSPA